MSRKRTDFRYRDTDPTCDDEFEFIIRFRRTFSARLLRSLYRARKRGMRKIRYEGRYREGTRRANNFDNFTMHLLILSFIPWRKYIRLQHPLSHACLDKSKNSLNHRRCKHAEEGDEHDGNCIRDPAGGRCNVNLWAYIASRKRARNSSVRVEGRRYVPGCSDPPGENVICKKVL